MPCISDVYLSFGWVLQDSHAARRSQGISGPLSDKLPGDSLKTHGMFQIARIEERDMEAIQAFRGHIDHTLRVGLRT